MTGNIRPALCAATLLLSAASAANAKPPPAPPPSPVPGQIFSLTCVDVDRVTSTDSFSFNCIDANHHGVMVSVETYADRNGVQSTDTDVTGGVKDEVYVDSLQQLFSQTVMTFILLKTNPANSSAKLTVSGIYSRYPPAKAAPAANLVVLTR